jgi:hypothetical protein
VNGDKTEVSVARLEVMFADIVRRMDEQHAMLGEIRAQTTKTNGRVNIAEVQIASLNARGGNQAMDISTAVLTRASLQWYALLVVGTISGTITVLRFLGMLK